MVKSNFCDALTGVAFYLVIDPSMVFSIFDVDQLAKIRRHHWKEHPIISKITKFESDRMKTNKDMALHSRKIL